MGLAASWHGPPKLEEAFPALLKGMEPAVTVPFCQLGVGTGQASPTAHCLAGD